MNDRLQKLLDIAKSSKSVEFTEEDKKVSRLDKFFLDIGLEPGDNWYSLHFIELLYLSWASRDKDEAMKSKSLHKWLKKKLPYHKRLRMYGINESALKPSRDKILRKVCLMIRKRADNVEEKTRSIESQTSNEN